MGKIVLFFIFILIIIVYPMLISYNYKPSLEKNIKKPEIVIDKGDFYIYSKILEKKGNFNKFYLEKNSYIALDLYVKDLIKKEEYKGKKTIFKDNLVKAKDVWYKNNEIELITNNAVYNKTKKLLRGGKFKLYATNFRGFGDEFLIDKNKKIDAKNIIYYLKVKE